MTYRYTDYKEVAFTDTETSYEIGLANGVTFASESMLLYSDQDCYIRFNSSGGLQIKIPAGIYMEFNRKTVKLYVVRVAVNGTLQVWSEGNIDT